MKKYSLTYAFAGIFLVFSAISLVRCHAPAEDPALVAEENAVLSNASPTPSNMDTSMLVEAIPAMEEPDIIPKAKAAPAAKMTPKQMPVASKSNTPQQKSDVKTPPVVLPATKAPEVVPPASTSTPKTEAKPAAPSTPKSPVVKQVGFSLKSTTAVIKGSSSLHAWESNVTKVEGKGSFETKDDVLVALKDVEIKIPVNGIKSKEGKKMDNKTYDTFQADKNPYIIFKLSNAVVKINASNVVTIEAPGKLTMAGTTQSVSLSASGKKLPNGDLQLSISQKLKMTDYKMDPPVMLLGTIKVGDEITVDFDFVLARISN